MAFLIICYTLQFVNSFSGSTNGKEVLSKELLKLGSDEDKESTSS